MSVLSRQCAFHVSPCLFHVQCVFVFSPRVTFPYYGTPYASANPPKQPTPLGAMLISGPSGERIWPKRSSPSSPSPQPA